jgi:sec-independent protein translocase protein TatB
MFDVGISEIMVIAVVALIVLGPEKLPKTARTLGHLFGRLQRYVGEVKADINRELALEDLKKLQAEVNTAAADFQTSMSATAKEVEANVRDVEASLNAAANASAPSAGSEAAQAAERGAAPGPERGAAPEPAPESLPPARTEPVPRDTPQQASLPGFDRG